MGNSNATLQSVTVTNFRPYLGTATAEFTDGLNVICGDNDQGKSAFLAAIHWVCTNSPASEHVINTQADDCAVVLRFSNGTEVERIRERGKQGVNEYRVRVPGAEQIMFKAMRGGVPDEITQMLNMGAVNFQWQHDPYYLVARTPGERGRIVNDTVNLTIVDDATDWAKAEMLAARRNVEGLVESVAAGEKQLEAFAGLSDARMRCSELEAQIEQHSVRSRRLVELRELLATIAKSTNELTSVKKVAELAELCDSAEAGLGVVLGMESDLAAKRAKLSSLRLLVHGVLVNAHNKAAYKGIDELPAAVAQIEGLFVVMQTEADTVRELRACVDAITGTLRDMTKEQRRTAELETQLNRIKPKECPLCGKEWTD